MILQPILDLFLFLKGIYEASRRTTLLPNGLCLNDNSSIDDYSSPAQLIALTRLELKYNAIQTIGFPKELINLEYLFPSGHDLDLTDKEIIRILNLLRNRGVMVDIER